MRMYCEKCGRLLRPDSDSCYRCDAPDTTADSAAAIATPTPSAQTAAPPPALQDLPDGVFAAAALYGVSALLILALTGIQILWASWAAVSGDSIAALLFGAVWNGLMGAFFGAIAYWIARLHRRGYSCGLCSGVLNTFVIPLLMVYNATNGAILTAVFQVLLFPLAVASAILLYINRSHFPQPSFPDPHRTRPV